MKDNVGQRAPAHRSPRQDPCFDPLIRSPVSRDSRAAPSGSFPDWKGLGCNTISDRSVFELLCDKCETGLDVRSLEADRRREQVPLLDAG